MSQHPILKVMNSTRQAINEMAEASDEDLLMMRKQLIEAARDPKTHIYALKMLEMVNDFVSAGHDRERRDQLVHIFLAGIAQMEAMLKKDLNISD